VAEVGRLPVLGETVLGSAFRTAGGGKGANQAVAAARVGAQVSLIGCVGEDANGRQLQTLLREDGVDISRVRVVAEPTGVAVILVETGGQNVVAVVPGTNSCLGASDVAEAQPALEQAGVLRLGHALDQMDARGLLAEAVLLRGGRGGSPPPSGRAVSWRGPCGEPVELAADGSCSALGQAGAARRSPTTAPGQRATAVPPR
jgi:sugar/nucleoside kinase (ribokinase family)